MGQIINLDDPFVQEIKVGSPPIPVLVMYPNFCNSPASVFATAGDTTYTMAQLAGGYLARDPNGDNRADTVPLAADILASLGTSYGAVGNSFIFSVLNTADAAEAITVTTNTGVTLVGYMVIGQSVLAQFLCVVTSLTTVSIYRIS